MNREEKKWDGQTEGGGSEEGGASFIDISPTELFLNAL